MDVVKEIILNINDLANRYSRGLITYNDYKSQRTNLLDQLKEGGEKSLFEQTGLLNMVNTVSSIIKRS